MDGLLIVPRQIENQQDSPITAPFLIIHHFPIETNTATKSKARNDETDADSTQITRSLLKSQEMGFLYFIIPLLTHFVARLAQANKWYHRVPNLSY
jgi:hypothetical protein